MNRNWQDYQKEIADDRYYYVRSCIRQNFFPEGSKIQVWTDLWNGQEQN